MIHSKDVGKASHRSPSFFRSAMANIRTLLLGYPKSSAEGDLWRVKVRNPPITSACFPQQKKTVAEATVLYRCPGTKVPFLVADSPHHRNN